MYKSREPEQIAETQGVGVGSTAGGHMALALYSLLMKLQKALVCTLLLSLPVHAEQIKKILNNYTHQYDFITQLDSTTLPSGSTNYINANSSGTVSQLTLTDQLQLGSFTKAQLAAKTPRALGVHVTCSDCTALTECTSTSTAVGAWSSPVAKTTACN